MNGSKSSALIEYITAQKELRETIKQESQTQLEKTFNRFIQEGGVKSQSFWKIRKSILKANKELDYDILNDKNTPITDPEEAKEHIAKYYEDLCQARGPPKGYENSSRAITDEIAETTIKWTQTTKEEITLEEIKSARKKLKRNIREGPDGIPNEVIIEAEETTLDIYKRVLNTIL